MGDAAISEVVWHAGRRILVVSLASGSRHELESLQPDLQCIRDLQDAGNPAFGIAVTTAPGARNLLASAARGADVPAVKQAVTHKAHSLLKVYGAADDDETYDFVTRYWAPSAIAAGEDPVTGSAHAVLAPFWAHRLRRKRLRARQCSRRGGELTVTTDEEAQVVRVSGACVLIRHGHLHLPLHDC